MRNLCIVSILILAFCVVSFAQTDQNPKCPAISVTGPASIVNPGETGTFTANVNDENWEQYIYSWTITGATIVEENGKNIVSLGTTYEALGKNRISFLIPPTVAGENLTATVEVKGLPEGCANTYSESMGCWLPPRFIEVGEFSVPTNRIDKARLDNLANKAQNNPSARIYIIERFEKKTLPKTIERKNQKTIDYLKETGMDSSRFTFINGYSEKNLTQIFIVPSGATAPTCDDCEDIRPK